MVSTTTGCSTSTCLPASKLKPGSFVREVMASLQAMDGNGIVDVVLWCCVNRVLLLLAVGFDMQRLLGVQKHIQHDSGPGDVWDTDVIWYNISVPISLGMYDLEIYGGHTSS